MRMNKDGLFKIMQITDMQEIPKVSPDTMALLDAAIEDEKPDLVVYYRLKICHVSNRLSVYPIRRALYA